MDEFGSRIQHSDQPSFAAAPLFYMPQQIAYTILWPLRDLETGGKCVSEELGFSLVLAIENEPILTNHCAFHSRTNVSRPKWLHSCNTIKYRTSLCLVFPYFEVETFDQSKNVAIVLLTESLNLALLP